MARHAQPLELAVLKGADKANPQRYKDFVPKSPDPLGNAPDHLADDAKAVWRELESFALPGVLTAADRFVLEVTSTLMAEYRRDPDEFKIGKYGPLIGNLARLGLSPADRTKLGMDKPAEENPFNRF